MEKIKLEKTGRGFTSGQFTDRYGAICSIQNSSLATECCIWLGVDDADPKILAFDAKKLGIETTETTGWVPFPIPEQVLLNTRMHLTREMAEQLIPLLEHFVKNGTLPQPKIK